MSTQSKAMVQCKDPRCDGGDDPNMPVWYCATCRTSYCDRCWNFANVHQSANMVEGTAPHEQLDHRRYIQCKRLEKILSPPNSHEEIEKLHHRDANTTWFGIGKYEDGSPFLQDYETFAQIMATSPGADLVKYPQLVSFVGETNAGKSTLIKMLIDYQESNHSLEATSSFSSPVTGSPIHDSIPTSADVHLYSDPGTWGKDRPMLYADCEGLNAGERIPMASLSRKVGKSEAKRLTNMFAPCKVRPLAWADSDETRTRQYAVTHTYPRLLYTFSDVVVFVLRNPKTFESAVLDKLFEWAASSLEASTNQSILPHAIIAINFTDLRVDKREWTVAGATARLLKAVDSCLESINGVHKYIKLADKWRRKGATIRTVRDLIECYYASFSVVRLPNDKDYSRLHGQIAQLHDTISERCQKSFDEKKKERLLSDSDDFNFYVQQAFNHFSRRLHRPFDFREYSLRRNPIPQDLGGYILRLAVNIKRRWPEQSGPWIFDSISYIVSSCVLYDCIRNRKGRPQDLFGEYINYFESALDEFCRVHWSCEFKNKKGRCVNIKAKHSKGHQNTEGKLIATGPYISRFSSEAYCVSWMNRLKLNLQELQESLDCMEKENEEESTQSHMIKLHQARITRFYHDMGGAYEYISHATCLCCLMRSPEHPLACGHVLCTDCAKAFGTQKNNIIEMKFCPLHPKVTSRRYPWKIRLKPDFAGVRVLSLDGGGIRGIAELEVLRQIQIVLGVNIPIRAFFDLIVGTSTGGIISLALGIKRWTVDQTIEQFKRLCDQAFTPRVFHGIYFFQQATTIHHGSTWKTTPLYKCLREAFGDSFLFGGKQEDDACYAAKVAVTTTEDAAQKAAIITNYFKKGERETYEFCRAFAPEEEFSIWEAGAATSAATPYFKPFQHDRTGDIYLDGAFYNNNPVKIGHVERKILWPDVARQPPDIFLSIGTTQNECEIVDQLRRSSEEAELPSSRKTTAGSADSGDVKAAAKWKSFAGMLHLGKAVQNRFADVLDSEMEWTRFSETVVQKGTHHIEERRYIRVNPDIGRRPPPLDAKEELMKLHSDVTASMNKYENRRKVTNIVFRLVASCFYFQKSNIPKINSDGTYTFVGKFMCRFEEGSDWLRELGIFFRNQQRRNFQPYLKIHHGLQGVAATQMELTPGVIERMVTHGEFEMKDCEIKLSAEQPQAIVKLHVSSLTDHSAGYAISGFPRDLIGEKQWKATPNPENQDAGNEEEERSDSLTIRKGVTVRGVQAKDIDGGELRTSGHRARGHLRSASAVDVSSKGRQITPNFGSEEADIWTLRHHSSDDVSIAPGATTLKEKWSMSFWHGLRGNAEKDKLESDASERQSISRRSDQESPELEVSEPIPGTPSIRVIPIGSSASTRSSSRSSRQSKNPLSPSNSANTSPDLRSQDAPIPVASEFPEYATNQTMSGPPWQGNPLGIMSPPPLPPNPYQGGFQPYTYAPPPSGTSYYSPVPYQQPNQGYGEYYASYSVPGAMYPQSQHAGRASQPNQNQHQFIPPQNTSPTRPGPGRSSPFENIGEPRYEVSSVNNTQGRGVTTNPYLVPSIPVSQATPRSPATLLRREPEVDPELRAQLEAAKENSLADFRQSTSGQEEADIERALQNSLKENYSPKFYP